MARSVAPTQSEYVEPIDPKEGMEVYDGWLGLRNNVSEEMFGRSDLSVALSVDINDSLDISRRKGYSTPVVAGVDRDLWADKSICLGVGSNALKWINPSYSTATLRTGLTPLRPLAYARVADRVYYANGFELGCVQNGQHRTWGIMPPPMPVASAGPGSLRAGLYQYAVTYLADDGQESGAVRAGTFELTSTGGISLSSILASTDPRVTHKVIYCTSVGGETLFRVGTIANSVTTFLIDTVWIGSSPCITQFLSPPPAGDFIQYWKGWMLVAKDNRLYVSEPYAPELFDLRKSFPFTDAITMIAALNNRIDGVWVGTESQVIWMAGDSPETWKPNPATDYGVIPGTVSLFDGDLLFDGSEGGNTVAIFATTRGLCLGKSDGTLTNLTQARFAYPIQERGAGIVRRHQGMAQYIVSLQGTEGAGNVFV